MSRWEPWLNWEPVEDSDVRKKYNEWIDSIRLGSVELTTQDQQEQASHPSKLPPSADAS